MSIEGHRRTTAEGRDVGGASSSLSSSFAFFTASVVRRREVGVIGILCGACKRLSRDCCTWACARCTKARTSALKRPTSGLSLRLRHSSDDDDEDESGRGGERGAVQEGEAEEADAAAVRMGGGVEKRVGHFPSASFAS